MSVGPDSPFHPLDPRSILVETAHCVAFLDRYPASPGHALVAPKTVVASLFDLPQELQAEVWDVVRQVRELLRERYRPNGFNIGLNDGSAAGQTVPHAHVHVIPRYRGDVPDPRGGVRWVLPARAAYWRGGRGRDREAGGVSGPDRTGKGDASP